MADVKQKLLALLQLTNDLMPADNNPRRIQILTKRAEVLAELGESVGAAADRLAVRDIERSPNEDHFELSIERASNIKLQEIAERNGMKGLFDKTNNIR